MSSIFGKKYNLPGYDKFRTGLTYRDVYNMLRYSDRKFKRRNSVLGFWHELKMQLYEQAIDRGFNPEADENGETPASSDRDDT